MYVSVWKKQEKQAQRASTAGSGVLLYLLDAKLQTHQQATLPNFSVLLFLVSYFPAAL